MSSVPAASLCCCRLHPHLVEHHYGELALLLGELADVVEQWPPDAVLVDLAPIVSARGVAPAYVAEVLQRVALARFGLATRIGLGPHPYVARLAAGTTSLGTVRSVAPADAAGFISTADVSHLPGVRQDQARALRAAGLRAAGDVADASLERLRPFVATAAEADELRRAARGNAPRALVSSPRPNIHGLRPSDTYSPAERLWLDLIEGGGRRER